jgi:hypothetical protein
VTTNSKGELDRSKKVFQFFTHLVKLLRGKPPTYPEYLALRSKYLGEPRAWAEKFGYYQATYELAKARYSLLKKALKNEIATIVEAWQEPLLSELGQEAKEIREEVESFIQSYKYPPKRLWERFGFWILILIFICFAFFLSEQEKEILIRLLLSDPEAWIQVLRGNSLILGLLAKIIPVGIMLLFLPFLDLSLKISGKRAFQVLARLHSKSNAPGETFMLLTSAWSQKVSTDLLEVGRTAFEEDWGFVESAWGIEQSNLDLELIADLIPALLVLFLATISSSLVMLTIGLYIGSSLTLVTVFLCIVVQVHAFVEHLDQAFQSRSARQKICFGASPASILKKPKNNISLG